MAESRERRILVCSEDASVADTVRAYWGPRGYSVLFMPATEEDVDAITLGMFGGRLFEIVLIDSSLPYLDAFTIVDAVWDGMTMSDTPSDSSKIVVLLESEEQLAKWKATEFQPHKFLVEPFNPADLVDG